MIDTIKMLNLTIKFIWRLTPAGRREQKLITRMNKFTRDIILKRIEEFRKLSQVKDKIPVIVP